MKTTETLLLTLLLVATAHGATNEVAAQHEFFGFRLTEREHAQVKGFQKWFSTPSFNIRGVERKGGACVAVWCQNQADVNGGDEIKINWLLPSDSRSAFERRLQKTPVVLFQLQIDTIAGKTLATYKRLEKKDLSADSGTFTISTPAQNLLKGEGNAYLLLLDDDMNTMNNILRFRIKYPDGK